MIRSYIKLVKCPCCQALVLLSGVRVLQRNRTNMIVMCVFVYCKELAHIILEADKS